MELFGGSDEVGEQIAGVCGNPSELLELVEEAFERVAPGRADDLRTAICMLIGPMPYAYVCTGRTSEPDRIRRFGKCRGCTYKYDAGRVGLLQMAKRYPSS